MHDDLSIALGVAYRNPEATDAELLAVLRCMATHLNDEAGETATRILHHRAEKESLQLKLAGILRPDAAALEVQAACQRLATTTPEARAYSRGYIAGQRRTA